MNAHELRKLEIEHERALREIAALSDYQCHVIARHAKQGGALPSTVRRELRDAARGLINAIRLALRVE